MRPFGWLDLLVAGIVGVVIIGYGLLLAARGLASLARKVRKIGHRGSHRR